MNDSDHTEPAGEALSAAPPSGAASPSPLRRERPEAPDALEAQPARAEQSSVRATPAEAPSQADRLTELCARLDAMKRKLGAVEETLGMVVRQQELTQGAIRHLGGRVTEAASSLGAPRVREIYLRLLLLYDLVEPPPAHLSADAAEICRVVSGQIEQFLAANGLPRIATDGLPFDRVLHKPVQTVPASATAPAGCIVSTVRNGFRSEQTVLRPAEVVIASGAPLGDAATDDSQDRTKKEPYGLPSCNKGTAQ